MAVSSNSLEEQCKSEALGSGWRAAWLAPAMPGLDIDLTANADLESIAHIDEAGLAAAPD
jgi:hypothetical protein